MHHAVSITILTLTLALASAAQAAEAGLTIAERGRSEYVIVVADDASPSAKHGAAELRTFLKRMTGADLPIVSDGGPVHAHEILVGDSAHLRQLSTKIDYRALGKEGYVLRTVGPHLVVSGGALRGTMYGVYGLLEDHLGCHWFTPQVSHIPRYDRLVIGPLDETRVPALEYRDPYFFDVMDADWSARNRVNGNTAEKAGVERGGYVAYEGFSHTTFDFISPDEYFDAHPEYFSEIDGKRLRERTQLCYTNEDVIRIITEKLRQRMREHPEADIFSVTQMDWDNHCQCEKCKALIEKEGTPAAPLLTMINRVADALAKEFPDKAIDTFAYQWSRKPPKTIRPRPNVIVRLCSIECCFSHPIATCDSPESAAFRQDIADWAKLCDRLWVWDYVTCFSNYLLPFPDLRVLDDNIRFFVQNHVTGVFEEGNYQSLNGEMSTLRSYLMAKFLWNLDADPEQAMTDFLQGVYGNAAGPIREYIDLLHDEVEQKDLHVHIFEQPDAPYLTDELLTRADALWDRAEAAVADQPEVSNRVRIARLSVDYAILERSRRSAISRLRIEDGRYRADLDPAFEARADRFFSVGEANNLTQISEWGGRTLAAYKASVLQPKAGWPVVSLAGEQLQLTVVPDLDGRLLSLRLRPDGPDVVYRPGPEEPGFPNAGGYAERWNVGGRSRGGGRRATTEFEATTAQTAEGASVLLTASLGDRAKLTRTVTVPARGTSLRIDSTLTSTSGPEQPIGGRTSFDLTLGPGSEMKVIMPDGAVRDVPSGEEDEALTIDPAALASGITLATPSGGASVRLIASGADLKRAEIHGNATRPRVTVTLVLEGTLPGGGSTTLQQTVEVLPVAGGR
jgi:Domain of unknown function (DUF4838)/Glycosyl hydrolase family 67 N-terminus